MAWRVGLIPGLVLELEKQGWQSQERDQDYAMVQPGGVLEVGYIKDNQRQIEVLLAPYAWLWAIKR